MADQPTVPVEKKDEIKESVIEIQTPIPPNKNRPKNLQDEAYERRMEIFELAKKIGIENLNAVVLAKQYKRADRIIRKDIQWIKGHIRPDSLRDAEQFLILSYNKLKKDLRMMLATETDADRKIKISAELRALNKDYLAYLEAWGIKEKVADKVNFTGNQPAVFNIIEKSIEEIKNDKSATAEGKPEASGDVKSS